MSKLKHRAAAAAIAALAAATPALAGLSVDFDNGLGGSNFTTASTGNPSINYNFDYSTYTYYQTFVEGFPPTPVGPIPSAPHSVGGTTRGMRLAARTLAGDPKGYVSAIANYDVTGPYRMTFDMWTNYNGGPLGGAQSTEFSLFGLNKTGSGLVRNGGFTNPPASSDGHFFTVTGEGGTSSNYRIYYTGVGDDGPQYPKSNATWAAPYVPGVNPTSDEPDNSNNAYYTDPTTGMFRGNESPGAPGKTWITVTIEQLTPTTVTWYINGKPFNAPDETKLMATLTLTSAADGFGKPFLGYADILGVTSTAEPGSGVAGDSLADAFVIFDNIVIETVPEPTSLALVGLACIGTLARRRRSE